MASDVARQYATADPLRVRMRTHELYEEQRVDLDALCLEALALTGGEAILDAGCGPGRFLGQLAAAGHRGRLAGLDQSAAMVAELARLSTPARPIEAYRGDVQALPFAAGSFERVVARHMLYHVPDIPAALGELRRVLRPGGLLLVTTNSERSLARIMALIDELLATFELPAYLAAAGFRVEPRIIDNALVFHDPAPIAAYAASILPSLDIHPGTPRYAELSAWLHAEAARRLTLLGGIWRDEKQVGVFVGERL